MALPDLGAKRRNPADPVNLSIPERSEESGLLCGQRRSFAALRMTTSHPKPEERLYPRGKGPPRGTTERVFWCGRPAAAGAGPSWSGSSIRWPPKEALTGKSRRPKSTRGFASNISVPAAALRRKRDIRPKNRPRGRGAFCTTANALTGRWMTGRYVPVIHLPVRSSFSLTCSVLLLSPLANFLLLWRAGRRITMRHAFPPTGGKGGRKCAVPSVAHAGVADAKWPLWRRVGQLDHPEPCGCSE